MANIVARPNGIKAVQFLDTRGRRRTVTLGVMDDETAADIAFQVSRLCTAANNGSKIPTITKVWLADLPAKFLNKFAATGIVPGVVPEVDDEPQESVSLGAFFDQWQKSRSDVKETSLLVYGRCRNWLVQFFGEDRILNEITKGCAIDWRRFMLRKGLAENTVRKMASVAKQVFGYGVDKEILSENVFAKLPSAVQASDDRTHFVSHETILKVIEHATCAEWKLIIALARFGGLRTPSETLALKWSDVDFEKGRIAVKEPKVEHHHGRGRRMIPLFPELRPFLETVFNEVSEDLGRVPLTRYVIHDCRISSGNLATEFRRVISRAAVTGWPKLFQNLRMSRQTELENQFPTHVVCKWLGNSPQVAQKHYLKVTEEHFELAMTTRAANGAANSVKTCHEVTIIDDSSAKDEESGAANALHNGVETGCKALQTTEQAVDVKPLPATKNSFLQVYAESCEWTILDSKRMAKVIQS